MADNIADGVRVVIPMLVYLDAASEIDFCKNAFGAVEPARRSGPDGTATGSADSKAEPIQQICCHAADSNKDPLKT